MTAPQRRDLELSRIYSEGAWPEPRKQIDDAILEASRRAARARHPILHRWGPPFALAATVIVGVSLALLVTDHQSMREADGLPRSDEPAPRAAPEKKREAPPARSEAAPKAGAQPKIEGPAPRELFSSPMGPDAKPEPKAPPPALPKRAPPPAAAKAPQPDAQRATRDAAPPARAAEAPASSASAGEVRGLAVAPVARSPEAWLDDIRKLKAEGRTADAERELAEFRRRNPDYKIPDDLR